MSDIKFEVIGPKEGASALKTIEAASLCIDKPVYFDKALKKASKPESKIIFDILKNKKDEGLSFGDLLKMTEEDLTYSELNHALEELKKDDALIKLVNKKYYLTEFGVLIFKTLDDLKDNIVTLIRLCGKEIFERAR